MITASQIVVLVLGFVVCALSAWGFMAPDKIWKLVNGALDKNWGTLCCSRRKTAARCGFDNCGSGVPVSIGL